MTLRYAAVIVTLMCAGLGGALLPAQARTPSPTPSQKQEQDQSTPPVQPPHQRPPGAAPAAEIPPHPAPATNPAIAAALPAYEGQNVSTVEIAGWPGLDTEALRAKLPQRVGTPFARTQIAASIAYLQTHLKPVPAPAGGPPPRHLQHIQLQVEPELGGLRVVFILEPADYLGVYEFPGGLRFTYARLLEASNYESQLPYAPARITEAVNGLEQFFHQQGYFQAQVKPDLKLDREHGLVNVEFHTRLGPRAKFGEVDFSGADASQAADLRRVLGSVWARLHRASVRTGSTYSYQTLQSAAQYLQSQLSGRGHLAAQVNLSGARYHPDTNRADITFAVHTGPDIAIDVTGAHLWPWTKHGLIPIYQVNRLDAEMVQEGQQDLLNYFSSHGYFQAEVTTTVIAGGKTYTMKRSAESLIGQAAPATVKAAPPAALKHQVQIEYAVNKGPRHSVDAITFSGNTFYTSDDLMPALKLSPGGWFSHGSFNAQLLRQSVANIENLYQASGYSSVQVKPVITHPDGNVAIEFQIKEGPQDIVQSLRFSGNQLPPNQLAPSGFMIGPGTPYAQNLISQDRAQVLATYLSHGYLNATFRAEAQRIKGQPHAIAVVYQIHEGPQVRTATVVTVGRRHTQQELVNRLTENLRPESYLTETDMLRAESQLYSPGILDWAEVAPRRPITTQEQEDVVIKVHEAKRNSLVYGFGFDLTNRGGSIPSGTVALPGLPIVGLPSSFKTSQATYYGPSVNVEYTRTNVRGKAETLDVGGFAGRLDQRGSFTYTDPYFRWTNFSANLLLSAEHDSQNPIFTSRTGQIGYQLEHPLNADKTTNLFLRYNYSQTGLTRLLIPDLVPERDRHIRLSTLSLTFLRDTRDNPLDAHKGFLESYELDDSFRLLGSSVDFARLITQTAYYRQLRDKIVWANSVRFGFDHAFGDSFVPLSQTFFSGGGSTLRGFPLDGAGPQETIPACGNPADKATCSLIRVPVGGKALLLLNSELRIPTPAIYPGVGIAVFYDGGNVFSHLGFHNLGAGYSNTVGVGLRYNTAVGPIRLDIGRNLNPIEGIKATQFFITLGQAF